MTGLATKDLKSMFDAMNITLKEVCEEGGIAPRSLYSLLNEPKFRSTKLETKLHDYASEALALKLPWDQEWSTMLRRLKITSMGHKGAMAVEQEFGRDADTYHKILQVVAEQPDLRKKFFDDRRRYVGAIWFVHIYWLCLAGWGQAVPLETNKTTAKENAEAAATWMIHALEESSGIAIDLLRFKATMNVFIGQWNSIKAEHRSNSQRLRKQVADLNFFEVVDKKVALAPEDVVPLVNALGVASAFKERERYANLEARIEKIDSEKLTQIKHAPFSDDPHIKSQYDTDFDDYRDWAALSLPANPRSI